MLRQRRFSPNAGRRKETPSRHKHKPSARSQRPKQADNCHIGLQERVFDNALQRVPTASPDSTWNRARLFCGPRLRCVAAASR